MKSRIKRILTFFAPKNEKRLIIVTLTGKIKIILLWLQSFAFVKTYWRLRHQRTQVLGWLRTFFKVKVISFYEKSPSSFTKKHCILYKIIFLQLKTNANVQNRYFKYRNFREQILSRTSWVLLQVLRSLSCEIFNFG